MSTRQLNKYNQKTKEFKDGKLSILPLYFHIHSHHNKNVQRYLGHCFWRETLINLHYSSLFPPLCLFPNHSLSPSISYKWASISLQLHTHSQRPLSSASLQGIWFFNEDSNNDYGYFKTIWRALCTYGDRSLRVWDQKDPSDERGSSKTNAGFGWQMDDNTIKQTIDCVKGVLQHACGFNFDAPPHTVCIIFWCGVLKFSLLNWGFRQRLRSSSWSKMRSG